jgi:hypothetical protein
MDYQLRRFLPRQYADWPGTYRIEGDPEPRWSDCRVIDISSAGAGLELLDAPDDATDGHRILVAVHLHGEIRNTRVEGDGRSRVGIQFVDLTPADRAYLASLTQLDALW